MGNTFAVVMAGGAGTRFWPASRALRPKQLLPLAGGAESLLAATVRRLRVRLPAEQIYIATGAHLLDATAAAVPEIPRANLLAEPTPRNTAPCIAWATNTILRRDPNALVAASDASCQSVVQLVSLSMVDALVRCASSERRQWSA